MFFFKKKSRPAWIFAFLGNPGSRYENTRHNAGFLTADILQSNLRVKINRVKFHALTASATLAGTEVLLLKPQTYMNLSGDAVSAAMRFYNLPSSNIVVVSDDISLPTGKLRLRRRGSAGGHNGLRDIIAKCGGEDFPRIKIGVGQPPHSDYDVADWVLSSFSDEDAALVINAANKACEALEVIVTKGIGYAMGEFNS